MPVKKRLSKTRRADLADLTREQRRHLLRGAGFFGPAFLPDEAVAAWEIHRDALLDEHIERFPGSRPWAWWTFDAPDPHPPFLDPADEGRYPPFVFKVVDGEMVRVTQEQCDYLAARGLLTEAEIDALEEIDE
jgi:hypothetical protein